MVISAHIDEEAFFLDLPPHVRRQTIFHCSLLEPCVTSNISYHVVPPPSLIELDDGPEYEVATILDSNATQNQFYYLVDWLGYTPSD